MHYVRGLKAQLYQTVYPASSKGGSKNKNMVTFSAARFEVSSEAVDRLRVKGEL